jgi:hypothetical protein
MEATGMTKRLLTTNDPLGTPGPLRAYIRRPQPTAMQSAPGRQPWTLTFDSVPSHVIDSVTGWSGGGDPQLDVFLTFDTLQEAVDYAQRHDLPYEINQPEARAHPLPRPQTHQMRQVLSGPILAPAREEDPRIRGLGTVVTTPGPDVSPPTAAGQKALVDKANAGGE